MYQSLTIIGNVGKDPEMRYTAEGIGVCSFSVAVSKYNKNKQTNQREDKTIWFKVSAWRQLAETCSQHVHKGMQIMVVGEVDARSYVASDGTTRVSIDVTAREIKFLSRRGEEGGAGGGSGNYEYGGAGGGNYAAEDVDDIPF